MSRGCGTGSGLGMNGGVTDQDRVVCGGELGKHGTNVVSDTASFT